MANTLDFNKAKKNYFTVILNDEKKTKLALMTPTKRLLTELINTLPELNGNTPTDEDVNTLYEFTARLMSRNKTGQQVTAEYLAEILDFEDLVTFFTAFTDFITEAANQKN